jgi:predicted hydrocarbon binding protein
MTETVFPARIMQRFVEALSAEVGADTLAAVLSKAGLPGEWSRPLHFIALDEVRTAQAYARLQSALRAYYGRGARGILLRIGATLWAHLLEDSAFGWRLWAMLIRALPQTLRRRAALDLLARIFGAGKITLHTLDLDLLLVDQTSPAALGQTDDAPLCFVTLGLIRACLFWADGQEYNIEERACRAMGARQCEFKITIGG